MSDSRTDDISMLAGNVVSVTTGSRLHFGLLSTAAPFGGVGVMIDHPQTEIVIQPATSFQCSEEIRDRVLPIAKRVQQLANQAELPTCDIKLTKRAASHSGLGSGTQLSMAVAEGLTKFCQLSLSPNQLACRIACRGERSAVGVHGYFAGGLIYEDADQPVELNPCRTRISITEPWCVGLFQPRKTPPPVSGQSERSHFQSLHQSSETKRRQLRSIINSEIIPAAQEKEFADFCHAVHRYNYQSGLLFEDVQGGPYNGPRVSELIDFLLHRGAMGVGQSSWGSTVFAWFENDDQATRFERDLPETAKMIAIAKPLNRSRNLSA